MAISDEVLEQLIGKLYVSLKEKVDAEQQINQYINALISIRKNEDGSLPIDIFTGIPITEERRSEILEATIGNSVQFVGGE